MRQIRFLLAAAALAFPFAAQAQDAKAGEAAVKSGGCLKCHSASADKDGPSYKSVAAKYKGKGDAAATLTKFIGGHHGGGKIKGADAAAYILSL